MKIENNKDLAPLHTMSCQAYAEFYIAVHGKDELKKALAYGVEQGLATTILGGGSNLVFAKDLTGLVIHIQTLGKQIASESGNNLVRVSVQAGENWHQFVRWTLQHGLRGLENLSLIPGTVGAAPIQNIGAYGVEAKRCLESVRAIHKTSLEEKCFLSEQCNFGYRDSIFKHAAKDWVIYEVGFVFDKNAALKISYAELNRAWSEMGCPDDAMQVSDLVCDIRQKKLPDPDQIPNAGSFFKNPVVTEELCQQLLARFPELVSYPLPDGGRKLAAGWLIQQAGWKGYESQGVGVYAKQALVLINPGHKPGKDLLGLAAKIQQSVQKLFGVMLEIEPLVL